MLDTIVTSQTRLKLLIKFFLFEDIRGYLRGLEKELHESSNSIRIELNKFIEAGLLVSETKGKKRYYKANPKHPLFNELKQIVSKSVGLNHLLNCKLTETENLEAIFIIGNLAQGIDSGTIELALVGQNLDAGFIEVCIKQAEKKTKRKIMYLVCTPDQMEYFFKEQSVMKLWRTSNPGNNELFIPSEPTGEIRNAITKK